MLLAGPLIGIVGAALARTAVIGWWPVGIGMQIPFLASVLYLLAWGRRHPGWDRPEP